jgi:D-beta-D-heptose 7-phosphate kinase/D-beta-D-heptose 1-phosphate adenosyltransferase
MTDQSALAALAATLSSARVLCAGDVMLDRFVYGTVDRISPEGPIPVLRVRREDAMLGGAGNVVRNLVGLGARSSFLTCVGDDAPGREVAHLIDALDGVDPVLCVDAGRQTTIKTRFVAGNQQLLRADDETLAPVTEITLDRLTAAATDEMAEAGALVLSDYGKGVLPDAVAARMIEHARARGVPVVVDPKGADWSRYRGATVVTPNRKELAEASGLPTDDTAAITVAARALIENCGIETILVTRSQEGMTLVRAEGDPVHLPAQAREVFDVSGAGDTVVATVAAALAAGASLVEAAALANVAASIVVGKVGTAAVHAEELLHTLRRRDIEADEAKVLTLPHALERVGKWRARGLSVGFTNGCFDLLHPGHVSLLAQARAECDRLVVGLNSDASVKRLKGDSRPVQSEAARAIVLGSLASVDMVVIFGEDTPLGMIRALRPDVLVKGADYTVDTVVGADVVQAYGGRVMLADLQDGFSTTATIARIGDR